MADIRIKDLATTATVTASDDFMAVDGSTNGTRKLSAATPSFLTSVTTPSLTSPAATNLTLAAGGTNQSVVLTPSGTGSVGIGTASPATLLTVYSAVAGTNKQMSLFDFAAGGATGSGYITVQASGNSTDFEQNTGGGGFRYSSTYFDTNIVNNATSSSAFGNINFVTGNTSSSSIVMTIGGGSQKGVVSIYNTTAGSSGAGALVVTGGLSAGNNGNASYFGGDVTISKSSPVINLVNSSASTTSQFLAQSTTDRSIIVGVFGDSSAGTTLGIANAAGSFITTATTLSNYPDKLVISTQGRTAPIYFGTNNTLALTLDGTTQAATFAGDLSAQRLEAVDAAASNRAAAFIRTQNNTTYSSSVLNIQGDRTTSNSSYNLIAAANGDSSGQFAVRDSGNVVNTNNSYGAISDQKLKENIVDATAKLQKLNQVRIVNFNRIGNEQKQIGVIAQELEQIFPSMIEVAIDRDAEGNDLGTTTKSVKYSVFVPMLIKAVQELTARLAALEAK